MAARWLVSMHPDLTMAHVPLPLASEPTSARIRISWVSTHTDEDAAPVVTNWPEWWDWDLEFSPHLQKRMTDRGFSETDLRAMLVNASGFRKDTEPGRWIVDTRHDSRPWQVIVEPDSIDSLLVVITAFPLAP